MRKISPLRHEAVRDTMWVGKGLRGGWLMIVGVIAIAAIAAFALH